MRGASQSEPHNHSCLLVSLCDSHTAPPKELASQTEKSSDPLTGLALLYLYRLRIIHKAHTFILWLPMPKIRFQSSQSQPSLAKLRPKCTPKTRVLGVSISRRPCGPREGRESIAFFFYAWLEAECGIRVRG